MNRIPQERYFQAYNNMANRPQGPPRVNVFEVKLVNQEIDWMDCLCELYQTDPQNLIKTMIFEELEELFIESKEKAK